MSKVTTAWVILLSATVFSLPANAAPLNQPGAETAGVELKTSQNRDATTTDDSRTDVDSFNLKYARGVAIDTGKIIASPLHWEAKEWLKAGLVLGVASSLLLVDEKVKNFAQDHQSPVASKFALVGNDLGNSAYALPPLGVFYLYGTLANDSKARSTSLLALESFAISGIMTSGLKMLAERHRPNSGASPNSWDGPSLSLKNVSFCSGHTATAFSIATVFADQYQNNAYVAPIAYGLATLTGLSRIYSNEHWSSDVVFGAALGYFVSKGVLSFHKEAKKESRLTLLPVVGKEMTGLSLKMEF